jgi:hypothetical protein
MQDTNQTNERTQRGAADCLECELNCIIDNCKKNQGAEEERKKSVTGEGNRTKNKTNG